MVLLASLVCAGFIGYCHHGYTFLAFNHDMVKGFASMHEIMLLSLMVGGLSGLAGKNSRQVAVRLSEWIAKTGGSQKMAQLVIAAIVSVFDILLANNTVAIVFSGEMARDIAKRYHIPPHYKCCMA